MANEERQNKEAVEQPGGSGETTGNQSGQAQQKEANAPSTEDERTGEGTGARAGEYS